MNKFRQPVIFTIDHTSFEVDIHKQVLRQTNDRSNEISFVTAMSDMGDHYQFCYDVVTKRPLQEAPGQHTEIIRVPQLVELDPEGMAAKYGLAPEQLKGKTDFDVIVDQEALTRRRQGILPQIDLAGEKFVVDLKLQELRDAQYFFPVISLKNFELTGDGWYYEAYYHPVMKQVVELDPKLLEFPEGVVKLRIPNELGLDPVATAKMYGMNERQVLRRYPIQKSLQAEVIPLSETHLPRLIRQNRDELRRQLEANMQQARPKRRPKF